MDISLLILVIAIPLLIILKLFNIQSNKAEYSYKSTQLLLTKAERSFYGALVQAVGDDALIFAKVRLADVLLPISGMGRSDWQRAFNQISSKHLDFVLCDKNDCSLLLGIELDDVSHNTTKAQRRDVFVNNACASAGFPLLRIKASRSYAIVDIRQQIKGVISTPSRIENSEIPMVPETYNAAFNMQEQVTSPLSTSLELPIVEAVPEFSSRVCPKCGEPMVLKTAKTGSNVGQVFWGCSAFPKCRS